MFPGDLEVLEDQKDPFLLFYQGFSLPFVLSLQEDQGSQGDRKVRGLPWILSIQSIQGFQRDLEDLADLGYLFHLFFQQS